MREDAKNNSTMNNRLREIVRYKTHGKQKEFAELIGWKPQYLAKLLHGSDFGLKPVLAILAALPEINARWLLLGEGEMLMDDKVRDLHRGTMSHIQAVLDLERFVPVMSPEELIEYEQVITGHKKPDFSPAVRSKWLERTLEKEQERNSRINNAIDQSDELCRQQTASE